ncbi:MAG: nicotinate-nucleotide--dimethylbenzimidazole phosphoribosyltransferase [Kangiellaceae bacterium]
MKYEVKAINIELTKKIQTKLDGKTKPQGSLGQLEDLAMQLALILGKPIAVRKPVMLVFAGDHGIANEGVSIAPSEVTQLMVTNFIEGGAAINCFCKTNEIDLHVIDAGILKPIKHPKLISQSLGLGTNNMVTEAAMSIHQVEKGIQLGGEVVLQNIKNGSNIFAFGEMGIGNTSSASAIQCALMDLAAEDCVGRGTGISDEQFERKIVLINQALSFHNARIENLYSNPFEIMASFAGFEIVQIVGGMLKVAQQGKVILVDGYIATAAAMLAIKINNNCKDYMIFCHESAEKGHQLMLNQLAVKPILNLGLRLGEGTGAALALPLIKAAVSFYNDMASFATAGIEPV